MKKNAKFLTMSAVIAALYVALTVVPPLNAISYGPIQFRISEALMALCVLSPSGVAGVTIGCLLSNFFAPQLNPFDLTLGTGATLLAAILLYVFRQKLLAGKWLFPLPVIVINGLVVGSYLPFVIMESVSANAVVATVASVAAGEAAVTYVLGLPLLGALAKYKEKLF